MRRRVYAVFLPWIVSAGLALLIPAAGPACCASAFADARAPLGGIGGSFFSGDPAVPPAAPAAPGPMEAMGAQEMGAKDPCGAAIAKASASHGLPAGLLSAIAKVESGRLNPQTGSMQPWPWTIDANGSGTLYATEAAAEQAAAGFEAAGITSLDIGCLQVNLAQHPDAFQSLAQAFDPAANADYAAGFLIGLQQKFGNWPQAVAAYHSQTAALGAPYAARVYAQWQNGDAPATLSAAASATGQVAPAFSPMPLPPPTALQMSFLIPPMQIMLRPGRGMTGRSLASYRAAPVAIAADGIAPPG